MVQCNLTRNGHYFCCVSRVVRRTTVWNVLSYRSANSSSNVDDWASINESANEKNRRKKTANNIHPSEWWCGFSVQCVLFFSLLYTHRGVTASIQGSCNQGHFLSTMLVMATSKTCTCPPTSATWNQRGEKIKKRKTRSIEWPKRDDLRTGTKKGSRSVECFQKDEKRCPKWKKKKTLST